MKNEQNKLLPAPSTRTVPLSRLKTNEAAFLPREGGINESHVRALQDALQQGQHLDPMEVWKDPATGALTVADGHHRLAAYLRHNPAQRVSVKVYTCARETALLIPIQENGKARLNLTYDERANWAWRLTVEGVGSKKQVATICKVSDGTVASMRRLKAAILKDGEYLPDHWREAQQHGKDQGDWTDEDREEWAEAILQKHLCQYGTSLSYLMTKHTDVAAALLLRCGGKALGMVVDALGYVPADPEDEDDFPF